MHEETSGAHAAEIAALNDAFRTTFDGGRVVITEGVLSLEDDAVAKALMAVRRFDAFTPENDPYGEHDFGALEVDGHKLFFKIDYRDARDPDWGSLNPADPEKTTRVMTVMLTEEY